MTNTPLTPAHNRPLKPNNKHHLAVLVPSPAQDPATARKRTAMMLQSKRHHTATKSSRTTQPSSIKLNSRAHRNTINHIDSNTNLSQTLASKQNLKATKNKTYKAQSNHRNATAQPRNRNGRVLICCCAVADLHVNKQRRQPDTRLPSCTQQTPQTQQQESLGRIGYIPSTRPHHCSKARMSDTENHAVREPHRLPHKPQTVTKQMVRAQQRHY